jgi:hypothetical protein
MVHLLRCKPWNEKLTITFEIPAREDLEIMIPIVASGKESPIGDDL